MLSQLCCIQACSPDRLGLVPEYPEILPGGSSGIFCSSWCAGSKNMSDLSPCRSREMVPGFFAQEYSQPNAVVWKVLRGSTCISAEEERDEPCQQNEEMNGAQKAERLRRVGEKSPKCPKSAG